MANISGQLLAEGDRRTAIMVAREALPANLDNPERPYVEEAEYALSQALQVYKTDNRFLPDIALKHANTVNFIKLSFDGKTAVTSARDGYLYVWETQHGDLLGKHFIGDKYFDKDKLDFIDDRTIIYVTDGILTCMDLDTMEAKWQYDEYTSYIKLCSDRKGVAAASSSAVALLDAQTGNLLFRQSINDYLEGEGFVSVTSLALDGAGRYLCVGTNSGQVLLFDLNSHRLLYDYRVDNQQITDVALSDGVLAVASSDFSLESLNLLSKGEGRLDVFDFSGYRLIERILTTPVSVIWRSHPMMRTCLSLWKVKRSMF